MSQEMMVPMLDQQCPVLHTTSVRNIFDIILDENIREPSYYRDAFQVFREAQQGDRINIFLNNSGGMLDTAICFVNSMKETEAEVVAILEGETHSAASIIALNAHGVHVKPYASMMIHHASFGSAGTTQNVLDHVNFTSKQTEKLIRETYRQFLTEIELDEVVRNREIWLTDDEISERLEIMFEARANEPCNCGSSDCPSTQSEEDLPEFSLEDMIQESVEAGVNKALDKLMKKYTLVPKEPKAKPVKKTVEAKPAV